MDNPNFSKWTREEKEQFAQRRLDEMRIKNQKLQERHDEVEGDRIKAENENCSVTNSNRIQRQERAAEGSRSRSARHVGSSIREWDRGKITNDDWGSHSHKGFKNYKTGYFERRYNRNDSWPKDGKSFHNRHEETFDKKNKRYNDQHSRSHYYDNSYKYSRNSQNQASYSYGKSQQSYEKTKSYYPTESRKKYNKCYSSSSADSEKIDNKVQRSNQEASFVWNSTRLNDDMNKSERTKIWVESVNLEQENISGDEKVDKKSSPKRKCDKYETESDKCLNESDHSAKNKSRQISVVKYEKNDFYERESCTQVRVESNRKFEVSKQSTEGKATKFDRYDHPDESSDESYDLSRWCNVPKKKDVEASCTSSKKLDSNEKRNNYDAEPERKSNLKSNISSKGNKSKEPSNFATASSSHSILSQSAEKSHNAGYRFDKKIPKKGFKTKHDPQYNSPNSGKNEHFTKQRKFDKSENLPLNQHRAFKNENYNSEKNKYNNDWNKNEDNKWNEADVDEDDNIWKSADQSDITWNLSDDENAESTIAIASFGAEKRPDLCGRNNQAAHDEGGWSTVEEGEIRSDNSEESDVKPKNHKKL